MTGDQSPGVSILDRKDFFHQNWNGEYEMECTQRDRKWWQGTSKETIGKGGYLEKYPFRYLELVTFFEKWCNMLKLAFAKYDVGCRILIFFECGTFDQK